VRIVDRLFVYGTLAPGRTNAHVLADVRGTWQAATVRGTRVAQGWGAAEGYPGLVPSADGESGDVVHGFVFTSPMLPAHWRRLDDFEGEGYVRVTVRATLDTGIVVDAQVYAVRADGVAG
jgi:gamma-glutamylcyclotransferase (GGCT)/AIG2-like uncharacterized protein YtfP